MTIYLITFFKNGDYTGSINKIITIPIDAYDMNDAVAQLIDLIFQGDSDAVNIAMLLLYLMLHLNDRYGRGGREDYNDRYKPILNDIMRQYIKTPLYEFLHRIEPQLAFEYARDFIANNRADFQVLLQGYLINKDMEPLRYDRNDPYIKIEELNIRGIDDTKYVGEEEY
jgi:hypothetical protein